MTLPRVDELRTPPVIGQAYLVPMVFGQWGPFKKNPRWWPVLGRLHEDAALIGFRYDHYHLDTRFLAKCFWLSNDRCAASPLQTNGRGMNAEGLAAEPTYRRAVCKRIECGFAAPVWREKDPLFFDLAAAFSDAHCLGESGAWVCPHREMPLGSLPIEAGIITCPLHGLRWRADTGEAA